VYFNNPVQYLENLNDDYFLPRLRGADAIVILTGQGSYEAPERSRQLSGILGWKDIPHHLDVWGYDVDHDWPWWRKMLPFWLDRLL
jgi:esterase/lipase superfamily enzyme